MRVALIGPVGKSESQLDRALNLSSSTLEADRVIYLGDEDLVHRHRSPSLNSGAEVDVWKRSLECIEAGPGAIDEFVAAERRKLDWARLEPLPQGGRLVVALAEGRRLSVCRDGDEDGAGNEPARLVVVGSAGSAEVEVVDGALHVRPGSLDEAGVAFVSDEQALSVEILNLRGQRLLRRVLRAEAAAT